MMVISIISLLSLQSSWEDISGDMEFSLFGANMYMTVSRNAEGARIGVNEKRKSFREGEAGVLEVAYGIH
jgi:hypothetical protein